MKVCGGAGWIRPRHVCVEDATLIAGRETLLDAILTIVQHEEEQERRREEKMSLSFRDSRVSDYLNDRRHFLGFSQPIGMVQI